MFSDSMQILVVAWWLVAAGEDGLHHHRNNEQTYIYSTQTKSTEHHRDCLSLYLVFFYFMDLTGHHHIHPGNFVAKRKSLSKPCGKTQNLGTLRHKLVIQYFVTWIEIFFFLCCHYNYNIPRSLICRFHWHKCSSCFAETSMHGKWWIIEFYGK